MSHQKDTRQIARAAGTVMFAFAIGQVFGLVRRILVAQTFGTSAELDAFLAANRVAETLFNLVAGGALGSAFIPTFTGLLAQEKRKAAWRMASGVANLVLLTLMALAALSALFAPQIVRYALAPGFAADPAQLQLTVNLMRIQLLSAILFGLSGLVMGILNAHQVFLVPALTPSMYQIGLIFGVLVLSPSMGIYGLAWGVVLGAALHLLLQVPTLLKQNGQYSLTLGWRDPYVREVIRLMLPRMLGVAVVQLNFWVSIWLASGMAEGSVSALTYGFSLMLMAQVAIAQSIATAAMPTFSAQYALGKLDDLRRSLAATLRGVIFLALPASVGLILLRRPIIVLLFQRGEFDARSTELMAWALLWYALGLLGHAVLEILARSFYALHDTKTPVTVGAVAMLLNVGLSFLFVHLFRSLGWMPHGGLAAANSLATALEAATLLWLMRRRLGGLEGRYALTGLGQAALASLGMGLALLPWLHTAAPHGALAVTGGGVLLGGAVYALLLLALRVPEVGWLLTALRRRLGR